MKTTVIGMFGGPGTGKSTTSARLYSCLKDKKISVELVREYAKDYAWEGRKIDPLTQLHLLGEQSARESLLYGKVRYVITDSPLILSSFYHWHYFNKDYLWGAISGFMQHANERGVEFRNIFLERTKEYDPNGRYETEEEAIIIDKKLREYLDFRVPYSVVRYDSFEEIMNLSIDMHTKVCDNTLRDRPLLGGKL